MPAASSDKGRSRDRANVTTADVDGGLLGPVPTPTRADIAQGLLSGLYTTGPALFWDAFTLVAETGYIHVVDVEPACGPSSCSERGVRHEVPVLSFSVVS